MAGRKFLKAPWWPHWIMLVVSLFLAAEYARLVLTTDAATYRFYILLVWAAVSVFWLVRIVRARRQHQAGLHT